MLCFTLYLRAISKYKPPRGLYLEGQFNRGSFAFRDWGAYIWRGLYMEGLIFRSLRYLQCIFQLVQPFCSTMLNKLCLSSCQENCVFATKCCFFRQECRSLNKSWIQPFNILYNCLQCTTNKTLFSNITLPCENRVFSNASRLNLNSLSSV